MNFCILGSGAWGTAMAVHLARNGHTVTLVPRRIEAAMDLAQSRENKPYLPGIPLDNNIQIGLEIKPAIMEADVVFLACPSVGLRDLCGKLKEHLSSATRIKYFISLCKGLDATSLKRPTQVISEVLETTRTGVLSGPAYAREVAEGKPTALVLAVPGKTEESLAIQQSINNEMLRVYHSTDVLGVEWGSCLKNVYAIGAGLNDGLQLGDNAKAAYLTRALHEMAQLGVSLGGELKTFYGLSGFGDMVATCQGQWSRNRTFGEQVGAGMSPSEILKQSNKTVEGYWATAIIAKLCEQHQIEAPILNEVHAILYENKPPLAALKSLMSRQLKEETV